jgi:hypothetical protein
MSTSAASTIDSILSELTYGLTPNGVGNVVIPVETAKSRINLAKTRLITSASEAGIAAGASEVINGIFDRVVALVDTTGHEVTVRHSDLTGAIEGIKDQLMEAAELSLGLSDVLSTPAPYAGWTSVDTSVEDEVETPEAPFTFDFGDYDDSDFDDFEYASFDDEDDYGYSLPQVSSLEDVLDALFGPLPKKTEATVTLDGPGSVTLTSDGKLLVSV